LVGVHDESRVRQIFANIRCHPSRDLWRGVMTVPAGIPLRMLADPSAQGFVLETTFPIPLACDQLEAWFSYTRPNGETRWDSDFGKNSWLRFPLHDLKTIQAVVHPPWQAAPGHDVFEIKISSLSSVDSMEARWRVANFPKEPRRQAPLTSSAHGTPMKLWSITGGGVMVPRHATVVFDLVYHVAGYKFTDDNQGQWYIAEQQNKLEPIAA